MKIIENRSVGLNVSAAQVQGASTPLSAAASLASVSGKPGENPGVSGTTGSLSPSALSMRASQANLAGTERALGMMSQLSDVLQKMGPAKATTPLQNSVLQSAASLQRTYPRYAQRLRNFMGNIDMLTSEITAIKRELTDTMKTQRQGIAKALVAEQNKDAAAKRTYAPQDAAALVRGLGAQDAQKLFTRRPSASELLQA